MLHPRHPPTSSPLPAAQRPASLDFPCAASPSAGADSRQSSGISILLHRELPQIPVPEPPAASPAPDQTYSNLLFAPPRKPVPDSVYECLAMGGEDAPVPPAPASTQVSPPRAGHGAADYACVRKVKKTVPMEVQDGTAAGPPAAPRCWDGTDDAPRAKVGLWGRVAGMGPVLSSLDEAFGVPCLPVAPMLGAGCKSGYCVSSGASQDEAKTRRAGDADGAGLCTLQKAPRVMQKGGSP